MNKRKLFSDVFYEPAFSQISIAHRRDITRKGLTMQTFNWCKFLAKRDIHSLVNRQNQ
jgi:hypothetical protein